MPTRAFSERRLVPSDVDGSGFNTERPAGSPSTTLAELGWTGSWCFFGWGACQVAFEHERVRIAEERRKCSEERTAASLAAEQARSLHVRPMTPTPAPLHCSLTHVHAQARTRTRVASSSLQIKSQKALDLQAAGQAQLASRRHCPRLCNDETLKFINKGLELKESMHLGSKCLTLHLRIRWLDVKG